MSFATELLDGHREMVEAFGASITMEGGNTPFPVVLAFPEASQDLLAAGVQPKAMAHFEIERTIAQGAGIAQESNLRVVGQDQLLHVTAIEDDPGSPLLYVSTEEVE